MIEGSVELRLVLVELPFLESGAHDDDEVGGEGIVVTFRDHRADLPFDPHPLMGLAIGFANGDADAGLLLLGFLAIDEIMVGLDLGAAVDDPVELPMGFDRVFFFHGVIPSLGGEANAAFGAAAGQNVAATVGFHPSAEPSFVGVLDFRGLISLFASHTSFSFA